MCRLLGLEKEKREITEDDGSNRKHNGEKGEGGTGVNEGPQRRALIRRPIR